MRELKREADKTLSGMQDQLKGDVSDVGVGAFSNVAGAARGMERHHAASRDISSRSGGSSGRGDFNMTIRSNDGSRDGDGSVGRCSDDGGSGPTLARCVANGSATQRRVKLERAHQRGPMFAGELLCAVTGCGKYAQYLHCQTGLRVCSVQCKMEIMSPSKNLPKGWMLHCMPQALPMASVFFIATRRKFTILVVAPPFFWFGLLVRWLHVVKAFHHFMAVVLFLGPGTTISP